jgi:hypothetical protein
MVMRESKIRLWGWKRKRVKVSKMNGPSGAVRIKKAGGGALVDMESSIASRPGKERYTPAVDGVLGGEKAMQCNAICKKRRGSKKTARC